MDDDTQTTPPVDPPADPLSPLTLSDLRSVAGAALDATGGDRAAFELAGQNYVATRDVDGVVTVECRGI